MNQVQKALKESALLRWSAIVLISIVMFSSYYFYDLYSAIKSTLQLETGLSNSEYGIMYGSYSFLNAFGMAVFGGIILDRWGIRKTGTIFISILTVGTLLTAYGATTTFRDGGIGHGFLSSFMSNYSPSLKMMIIGRVLFGLGAETFYVVINKVIAKWFKGFELAFAFAISLAFGRFGTASALFFSPRIADVSGINNTVWLGFMLALVGFIAFFAYQIMDKKLDKSIVNPDTEVEDEEEFKMSDLLALFKNKSFIYITLLCVLFYSAVFPFIGYAPDFLHNKFHFTEKVSGLATTILPLGTIIFTPLFGWYTDIKGKNASVMLLGSIMLIGVHLLFSLTNFAPYVSLFILGIAFSLVPAAMWPSVARIVPENRLGTAYGIMFSLQNWGLMLFPIFIGKVLDATNKGVPDGEALDYTYSILMLACLGVAGLVFAFLLKREDKTSGFGLELPNKQDI